jgi:hypothetical protein
MDNCGSHVEEHVIMPLLHVWNACVCEGARMQQSYVECVVASCSTHRAEDGKSLRFGEPDADVPEELVGQIREHLRQRGSTSSAGVCGRYVCVYTSRHRCMQCDRLN